MNGILLFIGCKYKLSYVKFLWFLFILVYRIEIFFEIKWRNVKIYIKCLMFCVYKRKMFEECLSEYYIYMYYIYFISIIVFFLCLYI